MHRDGVLVGLSLDERAAGAALGILGVLGLAEHAFERIGELGGVPVGDRDYLGLRATFGSLLDQLRDLDQILGEGVDQDRAVARRRDAKRTAVLVGFLEGLGDG